MEDQFARTRLLLGEEGLERLSRARVAVFGLGGVGGHAVEALARSGVGTLDLIDHDKVALSNLNRQIFATRKTVGRYKVDAARERIEEINPDSTVNTYRMFYLPETADQFDFRQYDYVVDAIDTVTGKIGLILQAQAAGVPVISSMGAGNKLDASAFRVADIYETSVDPLARVMRRELRKRGVKKLKVVYSTEEAMQPIKCGVSQPQPSESPAPGGTGSGQPGEAGQSSARRSTPGSVAFVPAVAGLIIAGEVVRDLTAGSRAGGSGA